MIKYQILKGAWVNETMTNTTFKRYNYIMIDDSKFRKLYQNQESENNINELSEETKEEANGSYGFLLFDNRWKT